MAKVEQNVVSKAVLTLRRLKVIKPYQMDHTACRYVGVTEKQIVRWVQSGVLHVRRNALEKLKFLAYYEGDAVHLPTLLKAIEARQAGREK